MTAVAAKTSESSGLVGKKELCALLGWSRPRLDRRLNEDSRFPVHTHGNKGGGWEFDPVAVRAYLDGVAPSSEDPEPAGGGGQDDEEPVNLAAAREERRGTGSGHRGEATARQIRDTADADLKIDRLKRQRGELVEAALMRSSLETVLVEIRSGLLAMPDALVKEFNLSERVGWAMRGKIEGMMRSAVLSLKKQLATEIDLATHTE